MTMESTKHTVIDFLFILKSAAVFVALDALILSVYWIHFSPELRNAIVMATSVKPESYTELYFENYDMLPSEIEGIRVYPFSFAIHNLEGKTMNYPYEVTVTVDGQKQFIDRSTVTLTKNETKVIDEQFSVSQQITAGKVEVILTQKHQSIDFLTQGAK